MKYTITIEGKAAAAAPKPTGKPRGRPPKDPAKKAAEAEQKKKDDHKKAISEFDKVYDERKKFLDAGIGDEFAGWETDVKRLRDEQNKLDVMHEDFEAKGDEIARQLKRMRDAKKAYDDNLNHYDGLLLGAGPRSRRSARGASQRRTNFVFVSFTPRRRAALFPVCRA